MDKRFGVILLIIVALIGGVFLITKDKDSKAPGVAASTSSHTDGPETATVELIEIGDFECPACGSFYPIVEQIRTTYADKLKFTFINFPLISIHRNAFAAHRAAEAASIQGEFFDMYDLLYQNQSSWSQLSDPISVFQGFAKDLGLNVTKFKADFSSEAVRETINADIQFAKDSYKANSTPTFILNGQKLVNSEIGSLELFSSKIDDAISNAENN